MKRQEFVAKYGGYVKAVTSGTGIFPETLFAQAILESSNGSEVGGSELAKKYNNYFGIKADKSWKGSSVNMKTKEFTSTPNSATINDYFRTYDSPEDSIADYVKFLKGNKRYANAGVFNASSPQEQANLLQKAGYATGAGYGKLVGDIAHTVSGWLGSVKEDFAKAEQTVSETANKGFVVVKRNQPVILATAVAMFLISGFFMYKYFQNNNQNA